MPPRKIKDFQAGLSRREYSVTDLVQAALTRVKTVDDKLGAYLRLRPAALTEAAEADKRLAAGRPHRPLEGVTLAVKDNLTIVHEEATAGSKILAGYQAIVTATAVARLQSAGAIVIGKTNLDEFAMGGSTENSGWHPTKNPWNTALVPGGSSGGSAVAVATDTVMAGLGTDTGGSIRQPASFCNVVGFKPTYGRVSRFGVIALASSLDQVGPFARTVEDAAMIYLAMAGPDDNDATTADQPVEDLTADMRQPVKNMRIGLPQEFFGEGVDPEVAQVVTAAADKFRELGAVVSEVSIPHARQALATYYIIQPAEASSNLARYDGIRYGPSKRDGQGLTSIYRRTREAGFGAEVKRRIMVGTFVLSAGYAEAYYHQANRVRWLIREEFDQVFDQVDVLLSPTSPTTAFPLGSRTQDPLTMYIADLLTVPANLANLPAMSLPGGFAAGLPVGIQLMAKQWNEAALFRAGFAWQQATDWHTKTPPQQV